MQVKYRMFEPRLSPRRTKTEMPGWAGTPQPRKDGSHEQVWHCMPFTEGAQYGIEVFYPFDNELKVTKRNGKVVLDGDFGPDPQTGLQWPPFRAFGENYYTYQLLLDLQVGTTWRSAPSRTRAITPTPTTACRSRCRRCCAPAGGR